LLLLGADEVSFDTLLHLVEVVSLAVKLPEANKVQRVQETLVLNLKINRGITS